MPVPGATCGGAYAPLGAAARWLGWLNAIGALVELGFSLGVLGADVAPPDLSVPLAVFLVGVLACGSAMLCWGLAQAARVEGRCSRAAAWLGAIAYIVALAAFVAGCWLSAGLAFEASDSQVGAAYTAHATFF
ncbi:hypothetical protein [Bordetella sp. BOR01]|uniref:hypothetical protein n=1 Tax=Bordetella sp. BOR01 TaxID=2854779 RepID=UPI001C449325|nr:hypothetical protein [Bordetella sp. BOR01]MBV7482454.1 hypothetical protein [Bordetella sp. BOR01]